MSKPSAPLRAYVVSDGAAGADSSAVLVFAANARAAKRMAWRIIVDDYMACDYTSVQVRRCGTTPAKWGVTEPAVLEPRGCERCERWYAFGPVDDETGLCDLCMDDDDESWT